MPTSLVVLFPLTLIVVAGGLAALQAPMNAALGKALGSPMAAATVSFGVGFAFLLFLTMITGDGRTLARAGSVNFWLLLGGFLGAFYVWAILWSVPTLGIVTVVSAMILGQLVVALTLDAWGPFGLPVHEVTPQRLIAVVLVGGGLVLSRL
ncbi:DMT family transporter [Jannaschia pohangensis]|uniref:Transporter family-2 protein n=1 Tax=Jannaschia pohangensis TaxID=390807 RepID=A0A1I3TYE2_9RHOB|nr:DMT family transporter [Jannaschia pohangensis]SFJ74547.1 transporter family-2 protein [Jannaschia pohangensis]